MPSLLYNLVGFANQKRLAFGFVSTSDADGEKLRRRFKAGANVPTVMIFKEEKSVPEVVVEVKIKSELITYNFSRKTIYERLHYVSFIKSNAIKNIKYYSFSGIQTEKR
jgi:hypothetical protein